MFKALEKLPQKVTALLFLVLPLLVGFLSSKAMRDSMSHYSELTLPSLAPPSWVFPVVWTLLFVMMGIASYLVYRDGSGEVHSKKALTVYLIQLVVNFFWPILFFRLGAYLPALIWLLFLWFLVLLTMAAFWDVSKKASLLLLPYLLWISFAAYLNFAIFLLNR